MNLKNPLCLLMLVLTFGSCATYTKTIREPNARVEFEKEDFVFSNQISGKAREVKVLGIDWQRLTKQHVGDVKPNRVQVPIIGSNVYSTKASSYALYNMLSDHPGYDVIFYPQFSSKVARPALGLGFIVKITDVEVKARLGKITATEGHTDESE